MSEVLSSQPVDEGSSPAPRSGDVIAGKYRVENVVGRGGMGVVVAAQHLTLGQKVAIKLLTLDGLDQERRVEACKRFLREGQAAARLTSDHVVRIYDVGTLESGAPFMVMELLRGEDLATLVDEEGPAPVEIAVEYILQTCDAVGEAHASGIVHRDLKPSNLFVARRSDGRPLVKVLDFGISKALVPGHDSFEGNLTATRSVVGSPYYMSPEQVRDAKRVDARADVWALGMILYELLVGEPAFNADTLPGICAAIAADTPAPIRDRRPDVSPELEGMVMRCLEKDPARRFQSVAELVQALAPFVPRLPENSTYGSRRADVPPARPDARIDFPTIEAPGDSGLRLQTQASPALDPGASGPPMAGSGSPSGKRAPTPVVRDVAPRSGQAAATLVSATGETMPAPSTETTSRRRLVVALGALGLVAAVAAVAFRPSTKSTEPAPASTEGPSSFALVLESTPSGATVLDGDRNLGTTPLTLTLANAELRKSPRRLSLRLSGYEPYGVVQGPSEATVRVLATLSPEKAPAPPEAPAASTSGDVAVRMPPRAATTRPQGVARRAPPPRRDPPPQPQKAPDIRLER